MDYAPFTMRQMVEAGMHFGHTTRRCNPKMLPWIFGQRNGVHIIDLEQSARLLRQALAAMRDATAQGGKLLIVGTKRQAQTIVAETARSCGQFYINRRWLGGTLTNWQTVSKSIDSLKALDEKLEKDDELEGLTKREKLSLTRRRDKIERALGGIREMSELPDLMLVIDTNKESTAIKEAQNLDIPIVAILDSNSNPDGITFPVPGNDDAARALKFYLTLVSQAVISGLEQSLARVDRKPDSEPSALAETPGGSRTQEAQETTGEQKPQGKKTAKENKKSGEKGERKGERRDFEKDGTGKQKAKFARQKTEPAKKFVKVVKGVKKIGKGVKGNATEPKAADDDDVQPAQEPQPASATGVSRGG